MSELGSAGPALGAPAAIEALLARGLTVATAESLTGGLLCGKLTSVPGASGAVVGAVVGYSNRVKVACLGVPVDVLDRFGPVSGEVALAMAEGGARLLGSDVCLSTTGEAGPDAATTASVGTVFLACVGRGAPSMVSQLSLPGDRVAIRSATCSAALGLLGSWLAGWDRAAAAAVGIAPKPGTSPLGRLL